VPRHRRRPRCHQISRAPAIDDLGAHRHDLTVGLQQKLTDVSISTELAQAREQSQATRRLARRFAVERGFQACPFYEKLGCRVFATLDDYPPRA
jgi:hypothetical protein